MTPKLIPSLGLVALISSCSPDIIVNPPSADREETDSLQMVPAPYTCIDLDSLGDGFYVLEYPPCEYTKSINYEI